MANKILIVVLSSEKPPYDALMRAQWESWDKNFDGVTTMYYTGENGKETWDVFFEENKPWRHLIKTNCSDDYYLMHEKFKIAATLSMALEWDIMFRTNSSCYVNKKKIVEIAEDFPNKKFYQGYTLVDSNDDNGLCVSGAGIFLSRDCVKILSKEIPLNHPIEEDVLLGRLLRAHGIQAIDDRTRVDYPADEESLMNAYHIKFKNSDRLQDAQDMILFHKKLQHEQTKVSSI